MMVIESYPDTVITRKPGAKVFLPTENEWYKAAYYDPTKGGTGGYYLYPTRSDTAPELATADAMGNINNGSSNIANYASGGNWDGQAGNLTSVGSGGAGSESAYGAADLAGNVFEWNETTRVGDTVRGLRGGSWGSWVGPSNDLLSSSRYGGDPAAAQDNIGFRVAKP
jgi:formylglycine-generating enzyme required for sulfatase activity